MGLLLELSKKDAKWRQIAYNICKDKNLADDLVQEMYLRLNRYNITKPINDYYIAVTLRNLFLSHCKRQKNVSLDKLHYIEDNTTEVSLNDYEDKIIRIIERLVKEDKLTWTQIELLQETVDKSLRECEAEFNINYGYIYRTTKEAKELILNSK